MASSMQGSPLIWDVFGGAGSHTVRSVSESSVLSGHFGSELSIVPLVALKARQLAGLDMFAWSKVSTNIKSAVLPGSPVTEISEALEMQLTTPRAVDQILVPMTGITTHVSSNPLFIPQNGTFRLADYGQIWADGSISGYYIVASDFPWHDNKGCMDPFILEELAAQIITYGFSARAWIQARSEENGALNAKFPLLTFKTSEVTYHTGTMPSIQDTPEIVLSGKVLADEKREARVIYTLYAQYNGGGASPLISGEIVGNKATILLMQRCLWTSVNKITSPIL